jgi:N-hydroxyarylamine O-acetyltransferase
VRDDIVAGYLRHLRIDDPGPTTAESLTRIHRAQVEHVAYNTVDIQLGRPTPITPVDVAERIGRIGRGGYCYHLNGALGLVLTRLGYDVRRHRGAVWTMPGSTPFEPFPNHLALSVHGLATAGNPGGVWFVDAGLGDAIHEPLPLLVGDYRQGLHEYHLSASDQVAGGWHFRHDHTGSFRGMHFESTPAAPDAFDEGHIQLSTSPTSGFVKYLTVSRRHATGVDKLTSCTLRRITSDHTEERELATAAEFRAALADVFGLTLDDLDTDARATLYQRARTAQDEWKANAD